MAITRCALGIMKAGQSGVICSVGKFAQESSDEMVHKLLEMGLLEGSRIEVVHEAPFSGDPLAVRVRGALIALRRSEAGLIEVELDE